MSGNNSNGDESPRITRYFTCDADLQTVFGGGSGGSGGSGSSSSSSSAGVPMSLQYISSLTEQKELADNLLLDPCSVDPNENVSLRAFTAVLTKEEAQNSARDVRNPNLQKHKRTSGKLLHKINLSDDMERKPLVIGIFEYEVPIAYRVLGLSAQSSSSSSSSSTSTSPRLVVRVVTERHCFAILQGFIVGNSRHEFRGMDPLIINTVKNLDGKRSKNPGEPLPIAEALAKIVLQKRGLRGSFEHMNELPTDIISLFQANEVAIEVEVVIDEEDLESGSGAAEATAKTTIIPTSVEAAEAAADDEDCSSGSDQF